MSRIVRPDAVSFARNGEEARPGGNRPRLGDTDPSRLWFSRGQQQMLDRLRADVLAGTGVLFLTGDVGTGKTFLARALVHRLRADAIIATPMYTRDDPQDFWREVGVAWGIEGAPDTLEALYDGLTGLLDGAAGGNKRVLLFVDEAQGLSRESARGDRAPGGHGRRAPESGAPEHPARRPGRARNRSLPTGERGARQACRRPVRDRAVHAGRGPRVRGVSAGARRTRTRGVHGRRAAGARHRLARHPRTDQLDRRPCPSHQLAGGNGGYRCRSGSGMRAPTRRRSSHAPAGHSDHPDGAPAPGPLGLALHSGPRSADSPRGVRLRDGLAARSHARGEHERSACRGARARVPRQQRVGDAGRVSPGERARTLCRRCGRTT